MMHVAIPVFGSVGLAFSSSAIASAAKVLPSEYFGGQDNQGYLDWIETSPMSDWTSTAYVASAADPGLGAALHWLIDNATEALELAVATKSTGWMAFGMSPTGGMLGSDLFVVESSNLSSIKDMHVLDARQPVLDECQNWKLQSAQLSDDGYFLVRVQRALDTEDLQDVAVFPRDGNTSFPVSHAIAAWGDETNYGYHGANRAHSAIRWHSDGQPEVDVFLAKMEAASDAYHLVAASNHSVLLNETEYAYFCSRSTDLADAGIDTVGEGVTIVGFEPIIDNTRHVHHFILYASTQDLNETVECSRTALTSLEIIYIWGPGEPPFVFPDSVGMPLGGGLNSTRNGYRTLMLEIHYNNPTAISDQFDSSGVRAYYNRAERRQHEAGVFSVGDPFVYLADQPIEAGLTSYTFRCNTSCSSLMLLGDGNDDGQSVTVIREYMHMHQSGLAMYNEHVRDGQVIRTGVVDFFEFDVSGGPAVQQDPFEIRPGDSFHVRCYYHNNESANRTFGLASSQEMCVSYLMYYPRKLLQVTDDLSFGWMCSVGYGDLGLPQCDAPVTAEALGDGGTVPDQRTFGAAAKQCSGEAAAEAVAPSNSSNTTASSGTSAAGVASRPCRGAPHNELTGLAGIMLAVAVRLL